MSVGSVVTGGSLLLAAPVAFAAGVVSFLSPCVLPLVPGYLSYVTGLSGAELVGTSVLVAHPAAGGFSARAAPPGAVAVLEHAAPAAAVRTRVVTGAALFVAGFSSVFVTAGALFGQLGNVLATHRRSLELVLGTVTVVVGLAFAGVLSRVPLARWLAGRELRLHVRPGTGFAAAPVLGALFGLGWSPCLGPALTAVYGLSAQASTAGRGALLGLAYCAGLGVPFVGVAIATQRGLGAVAVLRSHARVIPAVGGTLLIAVGLAEVTGIWTALVRALQLSTFQSPL